MGLDDAAGDGQAQARALLLGGEEGREDLDPVRGRDAGSIVAHADLDLARWLAPRPQGREQRRRHRALAAGDDPDLALAAERLDCVAGQVEQHLAQPLGIGRHLGQLGAGPEDQLDALGQVGAGDLQAALDQAVDVGGLRVDAVRPGVVEELLQHAVEPIRLLDDDAEELPLLLVGRAIEVLRRALDRAERVADLVRQRGGHLAQTGHPLPLLAALEQPGGLRGQRRALGQPGDGLDFVLGVGLGTRRVVEVEQADHLVAHAHREAGAGLHVRQRGQHSLAALALLGRQILAFLELAIEGFAQHRRPARAQAVGQSAVTQQLDARGRAPAVEAQPLEGLGVLVEQVHRHRGHPVEAAEARDQHAGDVPRLHGRGHAGLQLGGQLGQRRGAGKEQRARARLDGLAHRREEQQDHHRGDQRVEEELAGPVAADPHREHGEDHGQQHGQHAHHQALGHQVLQVD